MADTSISRARLTRFMDTLGRKPKTVVCDNSPELTSKAMFFWSRELAIKLQFIQPDKPIQNVFVESFNGKFREYCLNLHWFRSLEEAREMINEWRRHYNEERPYSPHGKLCPKQFAERAA